MYSRYFTKLNPAWEKVLGFSQEEYMLLTFLKEKEESLAKMKKALKEENWQELGALAHNIKSSIAMVVRADSFKEKVRSMEGTCKKNENPLLAQVMVEEFESMCFYSTS